MSQVLTLSHVCAGRESDSPVEVKPDVSCSIAVCIILKQLSIYRKSQNSVLHPVLWHSFPNEKTTYNFRTASKPRHWYNPPNFGFHQFDTRLCVRVCSSVQFYLV